MMTKDKLQLVLQVSGRTSLLVVISFSPTSNNPKDKDIRFGWAVVLYVELTSQNLKLFGDLSFIFKLFNLFQVFTDYY